MSVQYNEISKPNNIIWEDIKGYEGVYRISNNGDVFSIKNINSPKLLKPYFSTKKYCFVKLYDNDKNHKNYSIHRLVANAFIENPFNKPQINHINGIKHDNAVANLEWVTNSENVIHAITTGLKSIKKGSQIGTSKLSEKDVMNIKKLYKIGNTSHRKLAVLFNISYSNIAMILNGQSWKHIS